MSNSLHVCVVGYGYWGPKLVRNFFAAGAAVSVCDASKERLEQACSDFPRLQDWTRKFDLVLDDCMGVDAVVIATPPATHFDLALRALRAGKHVLVEKPLALNTLHAKLLDDAAQNAGVVLMVDHTFLYHPAVAMLKRCTDDGELGPLNFFDSTRVNLGLVQKDCDVLWDLAVHDVSILLHLIKERPVAVTATGRRDMAVLNLNYASGFFATINVSWLSPVKVRRLMIGGTKAVLWDDLNVLEPVKRYDSGIDFVGDVATYRAGTIVSPKLDEYEALNCMAFNFINCCKSGATPVSSPKLAREVVYILDCAKQYPGKRKELPLLHL